MLNGPVGLLIAVGFVAAVLLGGAAMSSLAERLERKVERRTRSKQEPTQEAEKPEASRGAVWVGGARRRLS